MDQATSETAADQAEPMGLIPRLAGVVLSPHATYARVARHPRWVGALVVSVAIITGIQAVLLSTPVGQRALLKQQVEALEGFGVQVTDQMYQRMEEGLPRAPVTTAATQVVFFPVVSAIIAGLLLAVFTAVLGGGATFRQCYAVVAHSAFILAIQQFFSAPIMYARGEMSSPTRLSVFVPMLAEDSFLVHLLGAFDLSLIWWLVNLAIGVAALYRRASGGIIAGLLGIYAVIAVIIAAVQSF